MAIGSGTYRIKNVRSGTYFDNSAKKPEVIHGWDTRPDSDNQKWHVEKLSNDQGYKLKNLASGNYVHANGSKNGTDVKARDEASKWDICDAGDGAYTIWLKGTKGVIDLDMGKDANGTDINIWESSGAKQQKWKFEKVGGGSGSGGSGGSKQSTGKYVNKEVPPGRYVIRNCGTGTALDLAGGVGENGTAVTGWQYTKEANQQWELQPGNDGYIIKNVASGSNLGHPPDAKAAHGSFVIGHEHDVEWDVKKSDDGFQLVYAKKTNFALDISGASASSGAKALLSSVTNVKNQKWTLEKI